MDNKRKITWKNLNRKTLKNLPWRHWGSVGVYHEIYLVPNGRKHDSGFMMISIVGKKADDSLEIAASPDDIHWKFRFKDIYPDLFVSPVRTDCSYPGGVMRFWLQDIYKKDGDDNLMFEVGVAVSSTSITVKPIKNV